MLSDSTRDFLFPREWLHIKQQQQRAALAETASCSREIFVFGILFLHDDKKKAWLNFLFLKKKRKCWTLARGRDTKDYV